MPENQPARTPRRWARSNRKGGRHRLGIHGRLHIGTPGRLRRNPQSAFSRRDIRKFMIAWGVPAYAEKDENGRSFSESLTRNLEPFSPRLFSRADPQRG